MPSRRHLTVPKPNKPRQIRNWQKKKDGVLHSLQQGVVPGTIALIPIPKIRGYMVVQPRLINGQRARGKMEKAKAKIKEKTKAEKQKVGHPLLTRTAKSVNFGASQVSAEMGTSVLIGTLLYVFPIKRIHANTEKPVSSAISRIHPLPKSSRLKG